MIKVGVGPLTDDSNSQLHNILQENDLAVQIHYATRVKQYHMRSEVHYGEHTKLILTLSRISKHFRPKDHADFRRTGVKSWFTD